MIYSRFLDSVLVNHVHDHSVCAHLRIDQHDSENLFRALAMVREVAADLERHGNIVFLRRTIEATAVGPYPARHDFHLTYGPILPPGITSITVTAPLADPVTVPEAEYTVLPLNRPRVRIDATTPAVIDALAQTDTVVRITYQAGFGDTADDIPHDLRAALLNQVATVFDDIEHKGTAGLSPHTARVLARYRGVRIA